MGTHMYEAFGCQAGVLPESGPWASGTLPTCELPMPCATHSKTQSDGNTAHRTPEHENGQNAEGQDHIHGICNKSEGGLRRSRVVTSFRVVVRTQQPNTHAHQHRSSSVDTLPSSSTVIHFVLFCHGSQITTFTNISKRWCIAWTHVRLAHGIAEAQP